MKIGYNTAEVQPQATGSFLWQPGTYLVEVEDAEVRDTKSGSGQYIRVVFAEVDGRRKYYNNYNVHNANPKTESIAREQFAALHHAMGLPKVDDTDELIGRRVKLVIGVRKNSSTGEDENVVRAYEPAGDAAPRAAAAASTKPSKMPWQ